VLGRLGQVTARDHSSIRPYTSACSALRKKKPSKKFREEFRHTLVSVDDAFARKKAVEDSTYPQPNSLDRRGILRVLS